MSFSGYLVFFFFVSVVGLFCVTVISRGVEIDLDQYKEINTILHDKNTSQTLKSKIQNFYADEKIVTWEYNTIKEEKEAEEKSRKKKEVFNLKMEPDASLKND